MFALTQTAKQMGYSVPCDVMLSIEVGNWLKEGGFCYSGPSWASGGENTACCMCFLSVLL